MNVLLKGREVAFYLEDPGAEDPVRAGATSRRPPSTGAEKAGAELILVKPGEFEKLLAEADATTTWPTSTADDTAVILYTSGTTGTPKGAELTHAQPQDERRGHRRHARQEPPRTTSSSARCRCSTPSGRPAGSTPASTAARASRCSRASTPSKAMEIIERDKVTIFLGVPTMYVAMLNLPDDKRQGHVLPAAVRAPAAPRCPSRSSRASRRSSSCKVLEGYGLSETVAGRLLQPPGQERKPGSIGTPIEGVEMKLVDDDGNDVEGTDEVGEIAIKGHNVMKGYWNREDATKEVLDDDGWFRTGDMGKRDDDGYYFIVDRKKEMIIRGGYNVYPREIEEVLYEHPAVAEAAVVGVPDDKMGEEVGAAVVLKEGEEVDADELRDFVKEQVANYKYPRKIWFPDELPKGPTGKILKREVEVPEEAKTA